MTYKTDIEIAQECEMLNIKEIAKKAHIDEKYIEQYGNYKANKIFQEKYNYQNQFLHAYKLSFLEIGDGLSYLSNKTFEVGLHKKEKDIIEQLMEEEC